LKGDVLGYDLEKSITTEEYDYYSPVKPVLFKTTSIAFSARVLILKVLAHAFFVAKGNSARGSGGANP
jgi:hypothetical protein